MAYERPKIPASYLVAEGTRKSMRSNRSSGTRPELVLRRELWGLGTRGYRLNVASLPGKPDLVFPRKKVAMFVHGCFWHSCPHCKRNLQPSANREFWDAKFARNRERDAENAKALGELGYRVLVVWECELSPAKLPATLESVRQFLDN